MSSLQGALTWIGRCKAFHTTGINIVGSSRHHLADGLCLQMLSIFVGAFTALFVVPITCALGALLFWRLPALKQRLLSVNRVRLCCVVIGLGLLTGLAGTIISGRNPGIP